MPSARISRGLVSLAASAITAVYAAGYLHTQSADFALGDDGLTTPVATQVDDTTTATPSAAVIVATSTVTPGVITDQAVELYADQHHVSWDTARAQMKAAGWVDQQTPPSAAPVPRSTPTAIARSAPPVAPTATQAKSVASAFKDGTYSGAGTSRRGGIQVSLTVQGGRIASVNITGSTTEYPVRDIASLPGQVVSRQSAQVDTVSGATFSSLAFRSAVQQALQRAQA